MNKKIGRTAKGSVALSAAGTAAMMLLSHSAHANTLVATIIGAYDATCTTCGQVNHTTITSGTANGTSFDTPNLFFLNPTGFSFTNVSITLTGYQDVAGNGGTGATFNAGDATPATQTIGLPDIAANSVYHLNFGSGGVTVGASTGLSLYHYDYDDQLLDAAGSGTTDAAGHTCGEAGSGAPPFICAFVGNFDANFEAMWNGHAISSVFSPDNTRLGGHGNVQGSFVGWEGLDQDGLSETSFDLHSGIFPGTLADIFTGTNQTGGGGGPTVPEPASLGLMALGLGALGLGRRRRKA